MGQNLIQFWRKIYTLCYISRKIVVIKKYMDIKNHDHFIVKDKHVEDRLSLKPRPTNKKCVAVLFTPHVDSYPSLTQDKRGRNY